MNVIEACNLLIKKFPFYEVVGGYEFDHCFLLRILPKGIKKTVDVNKVLFTSAFFVNKKNGSITKFDPFECDMEKLQNGIELKDFAR